MKNSIFNRNHYFVLGFLLGLILSFYVPEDVWTLVQDGCTDVTEDYIDKFNEDFEPRLNLINKPLAAKKPVKNIIRPRYYTSELGIREKLFVGVMTSQENINTLATAFNVTTAHSINRIKFFINTMDNQQEKGDFNLKNIVGFSDTRENLKPFHIFKYLADNYVDEYDYFLLIRDTNYVDARKLIELLYHISISFDLYMGKKLEPNELNNLDPNTESNYCDLDAGIVFSSSVIRKIRNNLDWCVRNAIANYHSINIGKCVKYSSTVSTCQEKFQEITVNYYKFDNVKLYKDLKFLSRDLKFRNSTIIYPITNVDDFFVLHAYFSRIHLEILTNKSYEIEKKSYDIGNGSVSNEILEIQWPLGVPPLSAPRTRHDIIPWKFLNVTHNLMPDHETNIGHMNKIDLIDFQKILNITISYAKHKYQNLQYKDVHSAYKKFDPVRGMDYRLHLNLWDAKTEEIIYKSFQIVKPLGRVEIVPSPYVTESTRIAIILPIFEHEISEGNEFVERYRKICMENQDNTFLMMVFLYRSETSSKDGADPFKDLKMLALFLSKKFKTDGSKIAWVSIRLPQAFSQPISKEDIMYSSVYTKNEILSLAVVDLSLRKIGLESLVMLSSTSTVFKADFLNRVRMNTIQGFQIYSPIGFIMYPCSFLNFCKECENCDVSQATGYFDRNNYDVLSFYSRDYVEARKTIEDLVPIIRSDNDIENLLQRNDKQIHNVIDMFLKSKHTIHILRASEPNLRFIINTKKFVNIYDGSILKCEKTMPMDVLVNATSSSNENSNLLKPNCIHLASRKQIGDAIIKFEGKYSENNL